MASGEGEDCLCLLLWPQPGRWFGADAGHAAVLLVFWQVSPELGLVLVWGLLQIFPSWLSRLLQGLTAALSTWRSEKALVANAGQDCLASCLACSCDPRRPLEMF